MKINAEINAETITRTAASYDAAVAAARSSLAAANAAANAANNAAFNAAYGGGSFFAATKAADDARTAADDADDAAAAVAATKACAKRWRKTVVERLCAFVEQKIQQTHADALAVVRRWCAGEATAKELRAAADANDEAYAYALKYCPVESDLDHLGLINDVYSAALVAASATATNNCFIAYVSEAIEAIAEWRSESCDGIPQKIGKTKCMQESPQVGRFPDPH